MPGRAIKMARLKRLRPRATRRAWILFVLRVFVHGGNLFGSAGTQLRITKYQNGRPACASMFGGLALTSPPPHSCASGAACQGGHHIRTAHASIESSLSNYLPPIWSLLQPLLPKLRLFSLNLAMRGHRRLLHHKHALLRRARLSINGRPRGRACGPLYSTCATARVVLVMQPPRRSCSGRISALTARDAWRATNQ